MNLKEYLKEYPDWILFDCLWEPEWSEAYFLAKSAEINSFPIGSLSNYQTYLYNIFITR